MKTWLLVRNTRKKKFKKAVYSLKEETFVSLYLI